LNDSFSKDVPEAGYDFDGIKDLFRKIYKDLGGIYPCNLFQWIGKICFNTLKLQATSKIPLTDKSVFLRRVSELQSLSVEGYKAKFIENIIKCLHGACKVSNEGASDHKTVKSSIPFTIQPFKLVMEIK
jgi:hypothetical protein